MKNVVIKPMCFALSVTIIGCYSQKKMENSNPTSYIFNVDLEQVRNAIKNGLGDFQIKCMALYAKEDYEKDIFNTDIKYDAILNSFCNLDSKIYYKYGKPLPYHASFHIHLDSISENKTKVEVFTLNPKLYTFGIGVGHFGYVREKEVSPSTIEEYKILLAIGEQLGEQGMPACNYPKKWLKYQEKHYEPRRL